jgi:hypothetical protein
MNEAYRLTTEDIARPQAEGRAAADVSQRDPAAAEAADGRTEPLLPQAESQRFTTEWREIQGDFVDRPRDAVEQADRLVADLMQRLASQFADTRSKLEQQWDGQDNVSTEELRVALTRYRTFFERLLAA